VGSKEEPKQVLSGVNAKCNVELDYLRFRKKEGTKWWGIKRGRIQLDVRREKTPRGEIP
jgi:hypothetical protein